MVNCNWLSAVQFYRRAFFFLYSWHHLCQGGQSRGLPDLVHGFGERQHQKIKSTFEDWRENVGREKFISPFGKMFMQMNDMQLNTGVTFHSLEPEPSFKECMQPTKQRPDYWNNLGSSKSRTSAQEQKAKELIEQIMEDSPQDTVFAFTDGSCRENP